MKAAYLFLLMLTLPFLLVIGARPRESPVVFDLEACEVRLSPLAKTARFQGAVGFTITTGKQGSPALVDLWPSQGLARFLDVDHFKGCAGRWVLQPSTRYAVLVTFGTTSEIRSKWSVSLFVPGGPTIRLRQPRRSATCG